MREAMTEDAYTVGPDIAVRTVAAVMAEYRHGSAIVVERGQVIGILTAIDGLRALSLLAAQPSRARQ